MTRIRIHKYLATAGVASRRACERLVAQGRVLVNGRIATTGMPVDPDTDRITVDGSDVHRQPERVVIVYNKPVGVLSTCRSSRESGRPVTDLVDVGVRLYPAGRLDRDSEGLLVLTNDGNLALRLTHPRFGKEKEYEVELTRPAATDVAERLLNGVRLGDGMARAAAVRRLGPRRLRVVLAEGRNRQVRRMLNALGCEVARLRRIRIGNLRLGRLASGCWRRLTDAEVKDSLIGTSA